MTTIDSRCVPSSLFHRSRVSRLAVYIPRTCAHSTRGRRDIATREREAFESRRREKDLPRERSRARRPEFPPGFALRESPPFSPFPPRGAIIPANASASGRRTLAIFPARGYRSLDRFRARCFFQRAWRGTEMREIRANGAGIELRVIPLPSSYPPSPHRPARVPTALSGYPNWTSPH